VYYNGNIATGPQPPNEPKQAVQSDHVHGSHLMEATREAGRYTQQVGTWLRYQPDDSVQTQSQVRRHEGAARHYYTDYYDPLTGIPHATML